MTYFNTIKRLFDFIIDLVVIALNRFHVLIYIYIHVYLFCLYYVAILKLETFC